MEQLNSRKDKYKERGGRKAEEVFVVPHLVESIGDECDDRNYRDAYGIFEDNPVIKKVIIPPNVTKIPAGTFRGCVNLEEIEFPCEEDGNTVTIGDEAFRDCVKLKRLVFHRTVMLGKRAFFNCSSLKTVTYGEGRNYCSVKTEAFGNCTSLREVTLPRCYIFSKDRVFEGCTSLEIIRMANEKYFKDQDPAYKFSRKKRRSYKKGTWIGNCPAKVQWGFKNPEVVRLFTPSDEQPDMIDKNYAFKPVYGGEEVVVIAPETVSLDRPPENPNHGLFEGNQTIKKVVLPASLVSIAPRTFFGCTNLETVEFDPYRKKYELDIGSEAFRGCTGLKEIILPGLVKIHTQAFAECKSLQSITIESVPKENMPEKIKKKSSYQMGKRHVTTSYVHIWKRAFSECESLTEVNIKSNIFEIKRYAFENCTSLKTIELPYVHRLGERLFSGCTSLETIYRAQKLKRLKSMSFIWYLRSERRAKLGCSAKVKGCKTKVVIPLDSD